MKKEMTILFVLLILSTTIPFVLSAHDTEEAGQARESIKDDFGAIVEGIEVENVFKREVEVPSIARFVLGIRGENVLTWEKLILTIGAWIIFFIIIHSVISIIPIFIDNEKIKLGISFVVLLLMSMTTGVTRIVDLVVFAFDAATFLDRFGPAKIVLSVLVLIIGIKGASIISSKLGGGAKMAKAEDVGSNINMNSKLGKIEADAVSKTD